MGSEIVVELINGVKIGLEHLGTFSKEDDGVAYILVLDLVVLRISFIKYL